MHDTSISRRRALEAFALGGIATTVLSLPGQPAAEAGEVALAKVPAIVTEAASRIFPTAEWVAATKDRDENGVTYELEGTIDDDIDVTVNVSGAGIVMEVTKVLDLNQLPEKVIAAVREQESNFKATDAAEVRRGDNLQRADEGDLSYEVQGQDPRGRDVTIEVTGAGKITEIQTEISWKEVPKVVTSAVAAKMPKFKPRVVIEVRQEGEVTDYVLSGIRPRAKTEIVIVVSADGKEIDIDDD